MYLPNRVDIIHNVSDAKSKESMASTNVIVAILVFMLAVCFVLQILYFE
jgi:preprotein translocase subunit SecE